MDSSNSDDFPPEMKQPISELHESLVDLKKSLDEFNNNYSNLKSGPFNPVLKAKMEVTKAYAINSLFWIYLTTKGVDPREHPIKGEITRLKAYAERVQQFEDKQKAMRLDSNAAKRFVRSALWEPSPDSQEMSKSNKRKLSDDSWNVSQESIDLLNKCDHKSNKKFKTK